MRIPEAHETARRPKAVTPRADQVPLPPDVALSYRINDAAAVSGLSRSTLYNLIAEKKLRSIVVAGRRLIPADALRDLIEGATAA